MLQMVLGFGTLFLEKTHMGDPMTKETVKHRKETKKKPALTDKERKAKKQEKKQNKKSGS
jgi:hypothetical protein